MINFLQNRIPIKLRLTLWYVLLMAVTFTMFAVYLFLRFQNSLKGAVDASLKINVSQTIAGLDEEDYRETGRLTFDHTGQIQVDVTDFAMRIISLEGVAWDDYGVVQRVPNWGPEEAGFSVQRGAGEEAWRVYSQAIPDSKGQIIGWVQASQSLLPVTDSVQDLRDQLVLGIPLILLLAGVGGYFLANRALLPIQRIIDTAREITAQDLSRRLDYEGVEDEVGRLAQTFDQMVARLQSSFERERRFTSDTAHELRTPLTVLKGQIEVTLSSTRKPSEYENKLRELSTQVERLIRLSNALLFLSRSDQNQLAFEPAAVNLGDVLEVLVEQFQPLAHEKNLDLTAKIPDHLPVYGDGDHLTRLFINVFENALKYTSPGGQVTVTTSQGAQKTTVVIHNTGLGISQNHLPYLFERFYRVDADRSSQTGGSGLGLAIAREIARLHKGEIDIQSEAGQGVTVSVHLPNAR